MLLISENLIWKAHSMQFFKFNHKFQVEIPYEKSLVSVSICKKPSWNQFNGTLNKKHLCTSNQAESVLSNPTYGFTAQSKSSVKQKITSNVS